MKSGTLRQQMALPKLLDLVNRHALFQFGCVNLATKYVSDRDCFPLRTAQSPEQLQRLPLVDCSRPDRSRSNMVWHPVPTVFFAPAWMQQCHSGNNWKSVDLRSKAAVCATIAGQAEFPKWGQAETIKFAQKTNGDLTDEPPSHARSFEPLHKWQHSGLVFALTLMSASHGISS